MKRTRVIKTATKRALARAARIANDQTSSEPPITKPVSSDDSQPTPTYDTPCGPINLPDIFSTVCIAMGDVEYQMSAMTEIMLKNSDDNVILDVDDLMYATASAIWLEINRSLLAPKMITKVNKLNHALNDKWRGIFAYFVLCNCNTIVWKYVYTMMEQDGAPPFSDTCETDDDLIKLVELAVKHFGADCEVITSCEKQKTRVLGVKMNGEVDMVDTFICRDEFVRYVMRRLSKQPNMCTKVISTSVAAYLRASCGLPGFTQIRRYCSGQLDDFIEHY